MTTQRFNPDYMYSSADDSDLAEHLAACFIRVSGFYYHVVDGLIDNRFRPVNYTQFLRYLEGFGRSWQDGIDGIPRYSAIVCQSPEECPADAFNQLTGMNYKIDYTPLTKEQECKIDHWIEHFTRVWTSGKESTEHLIEFFAMKLRYPFDSVDRMEQYVAFLGPQGCGKTEPLKRFWTMVFGKAQVLCTKFDRLGAKFNSALIGKLIVLIDDGGGKMNDKGAEKLKNLATDRQIEIEEKYRNSDEMDNIATLFITANLDNRINLESDDRRAMVSDVLDIKKNNKEYFKELYRQISEHHQLIVQWLLSNASSEDRLPHPPMTGGKLRVINRNKTQLDDFLKWYVETEGEDCLFTSPVRPRMVYYQYKDWVGNYMGIDVKPRHKQHDVGLKLKGFSTQIVGGRDNGRYKFDSHTKYNQFLRSIGFLEEDEKVSRYEDELWESEITIESPTAEPPAAESPTAESPTAESPAAEPKKLKPRLKPKPS